MENNSENYMDKINEASLWHAFYLDPDITEIKDRSKAENFISRYFL